MEGRRPPGFMPSIYIDWVDYTPEHRATREIIERTIDALAKLSGSSHEDWRVLGLTPIALTGPYGQGKTQLLLHGVKYAWEEKHIPAIYTTLDKLIPDKELGPVDYAKWLDERFQEELNAIAEGRYDDLKLMARSDVIDYIRSLPRHREIARKKVAIIFIDEFEQAYGRLLETVKTNDRAPMRHWLDVSKYLPIGAFASHSFYELVSGEAERRRWRVKRIPPISPEALRKYDPQLGNIVFWLSRGRPGHAFRIFHFLRDENILDKPRELTKLNELGDIAGVPLIDVDVFRTLSDELMRYCLELWPHESLTHLNRPTKGLISGWIVERNYLLERIMEQLVESIGGIGRDRGNILERFRNYLAIVLDGVSDVSNRCILPIPQRYGAELLILLEIACNLFLEFVGGKDDIMFANTILEQLEDETWRISFIAGLTSKFGAIYQQKVQQGVILSYKLLRELFPMPTSAPIYGGWPSSDRAREWIEGQPIRHYVAMNLRRTERGNIYFLYFTSEERLRVFLESEEINKYIRPDRGLVCVLLSGVWTRKGTRGVASWLRNKGRLRIESAPKLIGDFLLCAIAEGIRDGKRAELIDERVGLRRFLEERANNHIMRGEKSIARKISYFLHRLNDFEDGIADEMGRWLDLDRYQPDDLERAIAHRYILRYKEVFPDVVGAAFLGGKALRVLFKLKQVFEDEVFSGFKYRGVLREVIFRRSGQAVLGPISHIRDHYDRLLEEFKLYLVEYLQEDEFIKLAPTKEWAQLILKGIYRYLKSRDVSDNELIKIRNDIDILVKDIEDLIRKRTEISSKTRLDEDIQIQVKPLYSEAFKASLLNLSSLIEEACGVEEAYARWLLKNIVESALQRIREKVQREEALLQDVMSRLRTYAEQIKTIRDELDSLKRLDTWFFNWLGISYDDIVSIIKEGVRKELERWGIRIGYGVLWDPDELRNYSWHEIGNQLDKLMEIIEYINEIWDGSQKLLNNVRVLADIIKEKRGDADGNR